MDTQTNLHLRTNSRVNRVIFDGTKAVGVAYVPRYNRAHGGQLLERTVKARKYVVISSGTLGTPQVVWYVHSLCGLLKNVIRSSSDPVLVKANY